MNQPYFQKRAAYGASDFDHPRILLAHTRSAYIGPGMNLSPHKNAVATVAIALESSFELNLVDQLHTGTLTTRVALILPDTQHHLKTNGPMVFLYLDALSDDLESIDQDFFHQHSDELSTAIRNTLLCVEEPKNALTEINLICTILRVPLRTAHHRGVEKAIRAIDRAPQDFTNIQQAADIAGLSTSQFQRVFRDTIGTSFRRYRLWKRMAIVGRALMTGANLTSAAHEAGFSSSAHFSATFRTMFGVKPSDLISLGTRFEVDVFEDT